MITDRFKYVHGYVKEQETRKYHTRDQRIEALNKLVTRAYRADAYGEAIFHIPPQDDDADVILYNAVDELEECELGRTKAYIATIEGGSYGLRDFPNSKPGIWFGVKYGIYNGFGALIAFMSDEAEEFMSKNDIHDIRDIDGRKCIIVDDRGIIQFISMYQPRG